VTVTVSHAVVAYIALGSNAGDRSTMIDSAMSALRETPGVEIRKVSPIIETEPMGPIEQGPYLNAVVEVATTLPPRSLLDRCLAIEQNLGRDRTRAPRWGPRTIDLDLLLYGDQIIDEPGLHIPHPRMQERSFVLEPLAAIAPQLVHPVLVRSVECLLRELLASLSAGDDVREG
jgi:2-amino-4-hydroxy-6-hydroxymethyldihydropteridine diphosphokinase